MNPPLLRGSLVALPLGGNYRQTARFNARFVFIGRDMGTVAFGVGFLWSSLFAGEFTGTALCVISPVVYRILISASSALQNYPAFNYASFMSGMPYIQNPVKVLIERPLPWTTFVVLAAVSTALIAFSSRLTRQQDF